MSLGSPDPRDVVFIQRGNQGNNFYEEVHVSGSNLVFYTDTDGRVTAALTSSFLASVSSNFALSASWASHSFSSESSSFASCSFCSVSSSWASRSFTSDSSSFALSSISSSYSVTSSYAFTSSVVIITQSFVVSASHATSASWADRSGHSDIADSSSYSSTSSIVLNQYTNRGFKTINITTSSYTTALSVSLSSDQSAYLKVNVCGVSWPGVGPIGYVAQFLVQKGTFDTASTQPGVIIQEINNNAGGNTISAQIVDPGMATGSAIFGIQLIASGNYNINNATIVYDVMGSCSIA